MKKLIVIFTLAFGAGVALAGYLRTASQIQDATQGAPSSGTEFTDSTSLPLTDLEYYRIMICAISPIDTVLPVGSLKAYTYDPQDDKVARNKLADISLTGQEAARCIQSPDMQTGVANGRVMYITSGTQLTDAGTLMDTGSALDAGFRIHYRGWYRYR